MTILYILRAGAQFVLKAVALIVLTALFLAGCLTFLLFLGAPCLYFSRVFFARQSHLEEKYTREGVEVRGEIKSDGGKSRATPMTIMCL